MSKRQDELIIPSDIRVLSEILGKATVEKGLATRGINVKGVVLVCYKNHMVNTNTDWRACVFKLVKSSTQTQTERINRASKAWTVVSGVQSSASEA